MSYNERKQQGNEFESEVVEYLERNGYAVSKRGVEHSEELFLARIRWDNQPLAKFVKNAPDGLAVNREGVLFAWDAKRGLNVARDAWEAYQHIARIGAVFLFFKSGTQVLSGEIKSIEHEHGDDTTAGFGSSAHPRDRDGWICPRLGSNQNGAGSGSPYRKVRTSTLDPVENFPHTPMEPQPCQIAS
jgi:hypothetical protein